MSCENDKDLCTHDFTSAVISSTRLAHDQATQHSGLEYEGSYEPLPLTGEL